ncbi:hypothetical protein DRJ48_00305 [Candidatus Woesearchaeota archaeon]|nr:hypothetical protein [Candidatus Woesearchaeota archaeon]RLE43691.1 MAG: hypothetical protein DRJ48_00305 [Candidatus Woesearchaeota archaeon]
MRTYLNNAKEQLKRADHLIFVSLKYTRTVDILSSILKRLIACYDNAIMALLKLNVSLGELNEIPGNVLSRVFVLKSLYSHPEITELLNFYMVMRKVEKAEPIRSNEYRRGVRLDAILNDVVVEIDIDTIEEYFKKTETFLKVASKILECAEEDSEGVDIDEIVRGVNIDLEFERG